MPQKVEFADAEKLKAEIKEAPNVLYFQRAHYQLNHAIIFRSSKPKVIEITTPSR
jgi:hypothetical protein